MTNEWLDTKLLEFQCRHETSTAAKQPMHPTSGAAKQPHPTTAAKKQPHPTTQCNCCSNSPPRYDGEVYPRPHNQAKEARLYTTAKQLKSPAKTAASSAMVKQN